MSFLIFLLSGERASNDRELADLYEKWEQLAE